MKNGENAVQDTWLGLGLELKKPLEEKWKP
jgi:hypothetical protein